MTALIHRLRSEFVPVIAHPLVLFTTCFALSAFSIFQYTLNHDVSGILSMAGQMRGGTRLYADIVEINPPLIVWLSIPVSAAAELAHIAPAALFRVLVLALALACIGFAGMILHGRLNKTVELSLPPVICYSAIAVAGYDFGQREHLAVLLSMPYLATAVLRLNTENTRRSWRLIGAALAAVGFAFKPYFLLVPFLVEGLILLQTRRLDGSAYVIAGFITLYFAAILIFAPAYLPLAIMLSKVYGAGYLGISPFAFLLVPNFQIATICAAFAWVVRPAPRGIFHIYSAAALGFTVAALIQNKGWSYHWYPAAALCWLLFGLAATAIISRRQGLRRATPTIVGLGMVILAAWALVHAQRKSQAENPVPALFTPVIKELGGGPVMIFSNSVRASYPLVTQPGIGSSSSRLPTMALLSAAMNSKELELEKYLRDIVVADMLRKPPRLLIAETGPIGLPPSFDFIEYFSQDPAFARELALFRPVGSVANFRFFQRVKPHDIGGVAASTARD